MTGAYRGFASPRVFTSRTAAEGSIPGSGDTQLHVYEAGDAVEYTRDDTGLSTDLIMADNSRWRREATADAAVAVAMAAQAAADAATAAVAGVVTAATTAQATADAAAASVAANVRQNNFTATRAPLPTDDAAAGYAVGSRWLWGGQEWTFNGTAWLPNAPATTRGAGAAATGTVDDTTAVRSALVQGLPMRRVEIDPGTHRVHRASPTGGAGSTPQDWAINPNAAEWIVGNGIDTVLRAEVPNNNVIARVGLLPIADRAPDIIGGGISGVIFDGGFDASDPAARTGWTDTGTMSLWASGVQDWTLENVKSINSSDYGIGLQNGRHKRMRLRDLVIDNTMNDAIDLKNNYGRGGDNSMIGVWASRFGQATEPAFPFAGIDLMAPRWIMSHVWATEWGQAGDCQSGVRFKQGEPGDGTRDQGAYKAVLTGFHVDALQGGYALTAGIDIRHRRVTVAHGTIEGVQHSGVVIEQERATAIGIDIQGIGDASSAGVRTQKNGQTTDGNDAITSAVRVNNCVYGMYLSGDSGIHMGHHFRNVVRAVQTSGNDNVVMGISNNISGASVTDTGLRNWIGLWEQGKLNVYRQGKVRYSFGDVIESTADLSTLIERKQVTGGAGWVETTAPSASTGAWVTNTNGAYSWQRNGTELLRADASLLTAGLPVRLPRVSFNGLAGLGPVANGAILYCTNGDAGQPCLAVYDGAAWRRIALGAAVSAT